MGDRRWERIDGWLAAGGVVLAATERAARTIRADYDRARKREGLRAWRTPEIFAWETWVREQWQRRERLGLMLLNSLQERMLWSRVVGESRIGATLGHPERLALSAQTGYRLLAEYAPGSLGARSREGWVGDAAEFSEWLSEFEKRERRLDVVSASRVSEMLANGLREEREEAPLLFAADVKRPSLMLIGFDRLLPTQRRVLEEWGDWVLEAPEAADKKARLVAARDESSEMAACVSWLERRLSEQPEARLMVVATNLAERRGALERRLLASKSLGGERPRFEFSMGLPLGDAGPVRAALLLLRWIEGSLSEAETDWLLSSGFGTLSQEELTALSTCVEGLHRFGRERTEWSLRALLREGARALPKAFAERMNAAATGLNLAEKKQGPVEWVEVAREQLQTMGWPGFRAVGSVAFQVIKRWEEVLDSCASLGFDGRRLDWGEFLGVLNLVVAETIFATESSDAAVQITEPWNSAGQWADGIWFLTADEERWPAAGQPHPLLPIGLQCDTGMPHGSAAADWTLAEDVTRRLIGSADEVVFSYAETGDEGARRPSRLAMRWASGVERFTPDDWEGEEGGRVEVFEDSSRIAYAHDSVKGGSRTLTLQSLCPFQAFAVARLRAETRTDAEAGLNARKRGQLLHAVMRSVWGTADSWPGTTKPLGGWEDLMAVKNLERWVGGVVGEVMRKEFPEERGADARYPARLLDLEKKRLTGLVVEWLQYERKRWSFRVAGTELKRSVTIAGLSMTVQPDRIDVLADGRLLVIDYKTGTVTPAMWMGDRPDDVQLPLYAGFAMEGMGEDGQKEGQGDRLEGLVFAQMQAGKMAFCGRVREARGRLMRDLSGGSSLVAEPLTDAQLEHWRATIERLAAEFLAGDAEVDPKAGASTCRRCGMQTICRIHENQPLLVATEEASESEGEGAGEAEGGLDE